MEVENKQEKTDETTAACASAPAAAKKKKIRQGGSAVFSGQRGYGAYRHRDAYAAVKAQPLRAGRGDCFRPLAVFFRDAFGGFDLYFQFLLNKRYTFSFRSVKGGLLLYLLYYAVTTPLGGSHDSRADKERMAADIG